MKYLSLTLALLLSSCVSTTYPAQVQPPSLDTVVMLVTDSGTPICSGVLVAEGVLTAEHCVSGATEANVVLPEHVRNGRWVMASIVPVLSRDEEQDLALLARPFFAETLSVVAGSDPHPGAVIFAIGHPVGIPYVIHRGIVSTETRTEDLGGTPDQYMLVDAGLVPGMSGGPVFDTQGYLVGIVNGYMSPYQSLGIISPVSAITRFLEDSHG